MKKFAVAIVFYTLAFACYTTLGHFAKTSQNEYSEFVPTIVVLGTVLFIFAFNKFFGEAVAVGKRIGAIQQRTKLIEILRTGNSDDLLAEILKTDD